VQQPVKGRADARRDMREVARGMLFQRVGVVTIMCRLCMCHLTQMLLFLVDMRRLTVTAQIVGTACVKLVIFITH
jgi:hypothetical protein